MSFNLKAIIKKGDSYIAKIQDKDITTTVEPKKEETMQEIVIPVYEPEPEIVLQKYESDDEDILKPRKIKTNVISRKVPLNPLSD